MAGIWDTIDPPAAAPNMGVAPNAAPYGQTSPMAPMPTGAIAPLFRQKQTESASADADQARSKAEGAWDALQQVNSMKQIVANAPADAFGPIKGTDFYQNFNRLDGILPNSNPGAFLPTGQAATDLVSAHGRLVSGYNQLGFNKAKETLGRVTPEIFKSYVDTFGGPALTSREDANQQLDDHAVHSWDAVAGGINAGVVNPYSGTMALPRPSTPQAAAALGRGALYIHPTQRDATGKPVIMRNPL